MRTPRYYIAEYQSQNWTAFFCWPKLLDFVLFDKISFLLFFRIDFWIENKRTWQINLQVIFIQCEIESCMYCLSSLHIAQWLQSFIVFIIAKKSMPSSIPK